MDIRHSGRESKRPGDLLGILNTMNDQQTVPCCPDIFHTGLARPPPCPSGTVGSSGIRGLLVALEDNIHSVAQKIQELIET